MACMVSRESADRVPLRRQEQGRLSVGGRRNQGCGIRNFSQIVRAYHTICDFLPQQQLTSRHRHPYTQSTWALACQCLLQASSNQARLFTCSLRTASSVSGQPNAGSPCSNAVSVSPRQDPMRGTCGG